MPRPFLTARWEYLLFYNFECPRAFLEPHVPAGTTLDEWNGRTYVSLVAFLFRDTLVRGIPIPCHRTFEEVNLRFYVRRQDAGGELRRAVVFVKELVPKRAIAAVARRYYNEPYIAVPMSSVIDLDGPRGGLIAYFWSIDRQPYGVQATIPPGPPGETAAGSLDQFITEHYWGYTRQRDGGTIEYEVQHPRWPVWHPSAWALEGDMGELYGPEFRQILHGTPSSVLAAPGSAVAVAPGRRIQHQPHLGAES